MNSGGNTTLSYDYEDRLVSISRPGVATNTFAYNGFGARVSKNDSSGSNTYLRASSGLIGSIVSDSAATYTPGVSEKRGGTSTFYHSDIKNSVEQTSTSQSVSASKQYDAFGNEVSSQGPWQGPFQYGGAFGYHTDTDYGLKHLGARYYDPTTGRFLTRDPIKDGRNWYAYCGNNPVAYADPTGLLEVSAHDVLDAIGVFDPTGASDLLNGLWYAAEGDWTNAGLSLIAIVPYLGDAAKIGRGVTKAGRGARPADELGEFLQAADVMPYREAAKLTRGLDGALEAHHVLEARHLRKWGMSNLLDDAPAIVMPRELHVEVTRRLRSELPYRGKYGMDEVLDAYRRVYSDAPHLVTEVEEFLQPHRLGR